MLKGMRTSTCRPVKGRGRQCGSFISSCAARKSVVRAVAAPIRSQQKVSDIPADIQTVLFTESQVQQRVRELAREITHDYRGKDLIVVGLLKGAFIFMSDLTRAIAEEGIPNVRIDFIRASSYGSSSVSNGDVSVDMCGGTEGRWAGRDVLLVEDIIDSGNTLSKLSAQLVTCGAASLRVVTLLDKKGRRQVEFYADYVGFEIPDHFIVGMGLDFNETYRCLPYVAVLRPEAYQGSH